jgi:hypothetical protein
MASMADDYRIVNLAGAYGTLVSLRFSVPQQG